MISALSLADRNGNPVDLHRADGKVVCTDAEGLWGVESPRQVRRSRPTGHGVLNDSRYGDGRLASLAFEVVGDDYADTEAQFNTATSPMVETWDYGAAALKWTGVDARQGLTNLVTNPSFELDAAGWFADSGETSLTRVTSDAYVGSACLEVVNTADTLGRVRSTDTTSGGFTVSAGSVLYCHVAAKAVSSTSSVTALNGQVRFYDAGGAIVSTVSYGPTVSNPTLGQWYEFAGSVTVPANAVRAGIAASVTTTTGNTVWRVDQAFAANTSLTPAYFDGDSEWSYWTGTSHASTSVFDHSLQRLVKLDSDVTPKIAGGDDRRLAFLAQFLAEDPRAYHAVERTLTSTALSTASGGLKFPMTLPIKFTPSGGGTVTVINRGKRTTPPVFRVYGMSVNPAIVNVGTGEQITFAGTIAGGDSLYVDVANRSCRLNDRVNGAPANGLIDSANTTWFALPKGTSNLQMVAGTFDGSAKFDALVRDAY